MALTNYKYFTRPENTYGKCALQFPLLIKKSTVHLSLQMNINLKGETVCKMKKENPKLENEASALLVGLKIPTTLRKGFQETIRLIIS